jgi:hypothetical protein
MAQKLYADAKLDVVSEDDQNIQNIIIVNMIVASPTSQTVYLSPPRPSHYPRITSASSGSRVV